MRRRGRTLLLLATLAVPGASAGAERPAPAAAAAGCDALVDVTRARDPVAAVQDELNRWNRFRDEDGDRDNDRLHLCVTGRMKLDASMARRRHLLEEGRAAAGPIWSIFSVAPMPPDGAGARLERGLPVACSDARYCDRNQTNSRELVISFLDVVIDYDRSLPQAGPTALFQLGDGFLTGGRWIGDALELRGSLTIHVRGDGDGDARPFTVPHLDPERWIDDPHTLVFLYFDHVTRANTSDLALKILQVDGVTRDHRTVGVLNNQSFSKIFQKGTSLTGLGIGYWQMGVDHPTSPHQLMIRGNTIGVMIGDPVNGCSVAFSSRAKRESGHPWPCNGFRAALEYEGNGIGVVLFGTGGRIELRASRAEMADDRSNHMIILGAGVNSANGEICTSDAHAARQQAGSICRTVEDVGGDAQWPNVIFNGGVVPGDRGDPVWDGLVIANEYDGQVVLTGGVALGGNLAGGRNGYVLGWDGRPAGAEIVLDSWTTHVQSPMIPAGFPGRIRFAGGTSFSEDCRRETGARRADRCLESASGSEFVCWPQHPEALTCRQPRDWRPGAAPPLAGAGPAPALRSPPGAAPPPARAPGAARP